VVRTCHVRQLGKGGGVASSDRLPRLVCLARNQARKPAGQGPPSPREGAFGRRSPELRWEGWHHKAPTSTVGASARGRAWSFVAPGGGRRRSRGRPRPTVRCAVAHPTMVGSAAVDSPGLSSISPPRPGSLPGAFLWCWWPLQRDACRVERPKDNALRNIEGDQR
jgi:hypothetical protein